MHELAVCQALMTEVQRLARPQRGELRRIVLRVGPLSGIEPALLARAFDIARAGSPAAGAELAFEPAPVRIRCMACAAEAEAAPNHLVCAQCGGWRTELVGGDELLLQRLEFVTGAASH